MPNLYELMGDFAALQDAIDLGAEDGEVAGLVEKMDAAKGTLRDKVDNVCRVIKNIDGQATAVKNEKDRLARREKALMNNKERLREWVKTSMDLLDVDNIKTDLHTITLSPPGDKVAVLDAYAIPEEYIIKVEPKPDKKAILRAYKENGEIVAGVDIVKGESALTIR